MFGRKKDGDPAPEPWAELPDRDRDQDVTRPIRSVGLDLRDREGNRSVDDRDDARAAGSDRHEEPDLAPLPGSVRADEADSDPTPRPDESSPERGTGTSAAAPVVAPGFGPGPGAVRPPEAATSTDTEPDPDTETTQAVAAGPQRSPEERARLASRGRTVDDRPDPRKPSVWRAARSAVREFGRDQCTDLAAALTFYAVLSVVPAALALLSVLGLVSQPGQYVDKILQVLRPLVSSGTYANIEDILNSLATSDVAGVALVVGLVVALFSASGYVGAFGRAMNRILEVEEGRPVWKLRPTQVLVTVVTLLLTGVALLILVVSGPVARSVGDALGLQGALVTTWSYAKWPVLALIVIAVVGVLYRSTPNAKQPFRWISPGAFVAIVVWLVASLGFAFYVANVNDYDRTFGSVAGVVVALLWIWLTNLALLFGAELDSELERNRQLQGGVLAEVSLQLPLRDDRTIRKRAAKHEQVVSGHRAVRESFLGGGQVEDRPYR